MFDALSRVLDEVCCGYSSKSARNRRRARSKRQPNRALESMGKLVATRDKEYHHYSESKGYKSHIETSETGDSLSTFKEDTYGYELKSSFDTPVLFAGRCIYPVSGDKTTTNVSSRKITSVATVGTPQHPIKNSEPSSLSSVTRSSNFQLKEKDHADSRDFRRSISSESKESRKNRFSVKNGFEGDITSFIVESERPTKATARDSFNHDSRSIHIRSKVTLDVFIKDTLVCGNGLCITKVNKGERNRSIQLKFDPEAMAIYWLIKRGGVRNTQERIPVRSIRKMFRDGCYITMIATKSHGFPETIHFEAHSEQDAKILLSAIGMVINNSTFIAPPSPSAKGGRTESNIADWGSPPPYTRKRFIARDNF